MTNQHPITPPPELVRQWWVDAQVNLSPNTLCWVNHVATAAARWGSDQELEECCSIALTALCCGTKHQRRHLVDRIRDLRRPKLPTLKEQALGAMGRFDANAHIRADEMMRDFDTIRRALEALPND